MVNAVAVAPAQQAMTVAQQVNPTAMARFPDDIFQGQPKTLVKQVFGGVQTSCDKSRYSVSAPNAFNQEGPTVFLYIDEGEKSGCCERCCCGANRTLTLNVHQGNCKDGPVVQSMHKPFHCCFMRKEFHVYKGEKGQNKIGTIQDPCSALEACCCCCCCSRKMGQQVFNEKGEQMYNTSSPCCASSFAINQGNTRDKVGWFSKQPGALLSIGKENRFVIEFPPDADAGGKQLIFAAGMLASFLYYEPRYSDN
eukprot:gnl/MRDRNA2_/MRDRNA2_107392_c0_seq1.p1 gnl/MRDRNA2_/MRDRNA2_107392_c0~~gnl/MRDRNA2_/MRDRNA2_107392_c0_seq1.p1  ORF type:complete len:252 (+),score=28.73 gnl/MRDRNA2_/MRDRNA2_107392_c0_seq1:75-830(+)